MLARAVRDGFPAGAVRFVDDTWRKSAVRDLDPQLLRLREVEARIAFAERLVRDQHAVIRKLSGMGHTATLARDLLASLQESLVILEERRRSVLAVMQATDPPLAEHVSRVR